MINQNSNHNDATDLAATDPAALADEAHLVYVSDEMPGYARQRRGRGFSYVDPQGRAVTSKELRQRFTALAIPPAWTSVWICPDPNGHIQVTGRDDQERKQYIYHPRWDEVRNRTKFDRMIRFAEALPTLRAQVDADLRQQEPTFEKVMALVVRLLDDSLIRVGNAEYADQNGSYGLTTLRDDHVKLSSNRLVFEFSGKSGKEQRVEIKDRRLARLVRQCQELPGQQLFQYRNAEGVLQPVRSSEVNDYLHAFTGEHFTAKDFRTWGGTVAAAEALYTIGPCETPKEAQAALRDAVKSAAERLGNTTTVCRQYYIHPTILKAYEEGRLCAWIDKVASTHQDAPHGLNATERSVYTLLQAAEAEEQK